MDFSFQEFDTHNHYNHVFPTSSSSSSSLHYTYFSYQPLIDGLCGERSVAPVYGGVGSPSPVMLGRHLCMHHRFPPPMPLHGELFPPYSVTVPMPEWYGGGGGYHHRRRDIGGLEAVALQRRPPSPEIGEITVSANDQPIDVKTKKKIVVSGKPTGATVSGSKRKAPPSSSPTVAGSSGFCSNKSQKTTEEWRCAVCDISVTCERGLNEHLTGKKHLAKVKSLKSNNNGQDVKKQTSDIKSLKGNNSGGGDIGLGVIRNSARVSVDSKEARMCQTAGGKITRKRFKFWCKMCQTGAHDENVMLEHKKGKKHIKNRRKKARAKTRSCDRKNI